MGRVRVGLEKGAFIARTTGTVTETRVESQRIQDFIVHGESRNRKGITFERRHARKKVKTRTKNMSTVDNVVVFS